MADEPQIDILLNVADAALEHACAQILTSEGFRVRRSTEAGPPKCDVVVTDRAGGKTPPGNAAIVRIHNTPSSEHAGSSFDGDSLTVRLANDSAQAELNLACRLLGEIVTLRRQLRSEAKLRAALREQASTDPLTGLPHRGAWQQELEQRIARARLGGSLCVVIMDLDHFKKVNEARGFLEGDKMLIATGAALRRCLRQTDFVARLGGDEFGLLLEDLEESAAGEVVERVRAALSPPTVLDSQQTLRASAGYVLYVSHAPVAAEVLVDAADQALRHAKAQGRDRTVGAKMHVASPAESERT